MSGLPKTPAGRWAIGLTGGGAVCYGLFNALILSTQQGRELFVMRSLPTFTALATTGGLLGGGTVAALAIVRNDEQAALVWVALLLGIVTLYFLIDELRRSQEATSQKACVRITIACS